MRLFQPANLLLLCFLSVLSLPGCGDGHDHKDHGHKDHGHKDHDHGDGHKDHGHKDHGHDHSGPNPHVWLDPVRAKAFVVGVTPTLDQAINADGPPTARDVKPVILVTIFPLQSLVENIVGDKAVVKTLVAPGATPHGFEVKAQHLKLLREAKVLITVGFKFDDWATKAMHSLHPDGEPIIVSFESALSKEKDKNKDNTADTTNKSKSTLEANADQLLAKLDALHKRHASALANVSKKQLVTFHNAFDLLAERYGLDVVTHLTEIELSHGSEVPPKQLKAASDAVTKYKLKVLYSEPQFPDVAMQAIREKANVAILRLDPIGNPNVEGYRNYFEMMESNLKTLVDGQSR